MALPESLQFAMIRLAMLLAPSGLRSRFKSASSLSTVLAGGVASIGSDDWRTSTAGSAAESAVGSMEAARMMPRANREKRMERMRVR
ncbi:hypothetical protein D3C87_1858990 [compost metagenome]